MTECAARFFIGPVETDPLEADASWASSSNERVRRLSLSCWVVEPAGTQLSALFANRAMRTSYGPDTGILEPFWTTLPLWAEFNGLYLWTAARVGGPTVYGRLQTVDHQSVRARSLRLEGALVQPGQLVLTRSSRALPSAFVTGQALVANPVYDTDAGGSDFVVNPGGTLFTREYDPGAWGTVGGSRRMVLRSALPANLQRTVLPAVDNDNGEGVPGWVEFRGGDVRGYDTPTGWEVYGPAHEFIQPHHFGLTNGLVRFTVGERAAIPYLVVEVRGDDAWQPMGYLWLGGPGRTTRARLLARTPEYAVLALTVRGVGEILVTLWRGRRSIAIQHGSQLWGPVVDRRVEWRPSSPSALHGGWGHETWGHYPWGHGSGSGPPTFGGSPVVDGLTYEVTVDDGTTRVIDAHSFTRAVATRVTGASRTGLGLVKHTGSFVAEAIIATGDDMDDLADSNQQSVVQNEQTLRVS